jgi:GTPase SAR1 family protein
MATVKGNPTFKLIILGESGVGKSCLLTRYLKDKFDSEYQATVGCEFAKNEVKLG